MRALRPGDRVLVTFASLGPGTVVVACNWRDNVEVELDNPQPPNARTNCETKVAYLIRDGSPEPLF